MSHLFKLFIVCVLPLEALFDKRTETFDAETVKTVTDFGYPIQTHHVETDDGFILTIFRIPHGRNSNETNDEPVLLGHGMFGSAENFMMIGPKKSLAYVLANAGYDVWLINCRGTWHSKHHNTLKPEQKEFWEFSWHEIGIYDLPAVIDYILNVTKKEGIFYVGHSQGGTIAFVMASEKPEYNKKIKLMIGLSPGAIYRNMKSPVVRWAAANYKLLQNLSESLQIYELPPPFFSDYDVRELIKSLCVESVALKNSCKSIFMLITNENQEMFDSKSLPSVLSNMPASISTKQAYHYAQLILSGNFQKYDYGPDLNNEKYGAVNPPLYKLKNVKFPIAIFSGMGDVLVSEKDTQLLAQNLANLVAYEKIPLGSFGHNDFIFAKNINNLVYSKMLKIMEKFGNK